MLSMVGRQTEVVECDEINVSFKYDLYEYFDKSGKGKLSLAQNAFAEIYDNMGAAIVQKSYMSIGVSINSNAYRFFEVLRWFWNIPNLNFHFYVHTIS